MLQDVGVEVVASAGKPVGRLQQIDVDADTGRPAWASVDVGPTGYAVKLAPLEGATVTGDQLQVGYPFTMINEAPEVGDAENLWLEEEDELYAHYRLDHPPNA